MLVVVASASCTLSSIKFHEMFMLVSGFKLDRDTMGMFRIVYHF